MVKKKSEKGKGQPAVKRQRSDEQHERQRSDMSCNPLPVSLLRRFLLFPRVDTPAPAQAPLVKVVITELRHKGKGTFFAKGKGTFFAKGKGDKGKGSR
jgi:hypothetical protein